MNAKTLIKLLIIAVALSAASHSYASSSGNFANLFFDPNLDQFMVELGTHRDSGLRALKDRIELIEQSEGQFSPALYGYLAELGRIRHANAQHQEAINVYQRMQTLAHWADGVNSPLQLEAVRLQSRSLIAEGEIVAADKLERFHFRIAEKNFSGEELLPSIWRISAWQRMTMQYDKALANYDRTLRIIQNESLSSAYRVRALEAKALTQHLATRCCADESLEAALQDRYNGNFSDHADNQAAVLNLADLATLYNSKGASSLYARLDNVPVALLGPKSNSAYLKAIDSVTQNQFLSVRSEVWYPKEEHGMTFSSKPETKPEPATIGDPVRLCTSQIKREGFVDVSMDISETGKPRNLTITGKVSSKTKKYLRAILLKSRYRPEFQDGEAVAATLEFRQYFDRAKPIRSDQVAGWRDLLAEHACQVVAMR